VPWPPAHVLDTPPAAIPSSPPSLREESSAAEWDATRWLVDGSLRAVMRSAHAIQAKLTQLDAGGDVDYTRREEQWIAVRRSAAPPSAASPKTRGSIG
jgi:hypothetical protein